MFEDVVAGKRKQYQIEKRYIRKDGDIVWGRLTLSSSDESEGGPRFLIAMIEDITEHKRMEEALEKSERYYRALTENAYDGVVVVNEDGNISYEGPSIKRILGYEPNEFIGRKGFEYIHDSDAVKAIENFKLLLENPGITMSTELRVLHINGSWRTLDIAATNLLSDEHIKGVIVNYRDITERKQAEEIQRQQEQYFRSLIENSSDTIVVLNDNGTVRYLSPSYENLLGRDPLTTVGSGVLENVHRDDKKKVSEMLAYLEQNPGNAIHSEVRIRHKNGSWRWIEATATSRLNDPIVSGIVVNMRDVTQRKKAEEDLQELYDKERESRHKMEIEMKRRVEFTRALAHELKTPLTPVLASSDSLLSNVQEEPLLSLARNISLGAANLNSRIDELLDMARGEIGMLQLRIEAVDIIKLLQETTSSMIPRASNQGQFLVLDLPSSLPVIQADFTRVQQVVTNLLDNALKFTPRGGKVVVKAKEKDKSLVIEVRDTGRGIYKKDQERLFDPYYRLENGEDHVSGLGIGLALCKTLIDLHGGNIWVKSQVGTGSTFGFSLPLETSSQQISVLDRRRKLWKVLIIEDDPVIVDSISLALKMDWPEVEMITTSLGDDGIDLVETENPDVVVLDLGLPDMSGFEVLEQIRLFSSVPVVVLTVKTEESDMVKALEQGADDYIVKPFRQKELLARLKVQMRKKGTLDEDGILVCGSLRFNTNTSQLWDGAKEISLTIIEGRIVESLIKNAGQVVTYTHLAEDVWGDDYHGAIHSLRVNIGRLRQKIEEDESLLGGGM